jgi:hypothetical protein
MRAAVMNMQLATDACDACFAVDVWGTPASFHLKSVTDLPAGTSKNQPWMAWVGKREERLAEHVIGVMWKV